MRSVSISIVLVLRFFLLGTFALSLASCGNLADVTNDWSVEKLYAEAKEDTANQAYERAISHYGKLENRALGTPLAQQAQIEKAYAQYKLGSQVDAIATLDRFMRLHPASTLIDYALYLRGLVQFNDDLGFLSNIAKQKLHDRDQKAQKEAYASFQQLTTRFPDSKYAKDAKERMAYILNTLAFYEVNVANYYASQGAHLAAANRAQTAISEYPNSPATEEALTILIQSYEALGKKQLSEDAKRVMAKNFPKNILAASVGSSDVVSRPQKP